MKECGHNFKCIKRAFLSDLSNLILMISSEEIINKYNQEI